MKLLTSSIINILKYTGKVVTFIRNTFLNLFFLLILIIVAYSFFESTQTPEVTVNTSSILRLDFYGNIVEERKILSSIEMILEDPFFSQANQQETLLQDILDVINKSTTDEQIEVIQLNLKKMDRAGLNQLETIGLALNNFKMAGKKVIAVEDNYSQSQYFLASFADTIIINPMGRVDIHGLGVYKLYFKDALDRLKINYNIFKVGTYKSAVEPFTRTSMSTQDQQQNKVWLSKLWQSYSERVTTNRNLNSFQLRRYTNNVAKELAAAKGNTAQLALNIGLVDKIMTHAEIINHLNQLSHTTGDTLAVTSTETYLEGITPSFTNAGTDKPGIGIIIAEGTILPGKQPTGLIGGESLATLINKARIDKDIKALVLRINSGGGSAFASEIIRQALLEFKKTGKPLVVSMGSVAASGGYWIAADADEIWAAPTTITGSIGIFAAIPTFEKSLGALGIYSDGVGTTPLAAGVNVTRELSQDLKNVIQQNVEYNYGQFIAIVAKGRNLDIASVEKLAEGRVYDGTTAQKIGLVDHLGSLAEAIQSTAKLAGLTDYKARYIQSPSTVKDQLLHYLTTSLPALSSSQDNHWLKAIKDIFSSQINQFITLDDPAGIYAICEIGPYLR